MAAAVTGLRTATADDVGYLRRLAREESIAEFLSTDTPDEIGPGVEAGEYHVILAGDDAVGGVRLAVINRRSRIGDVRALMVDPAHRGQGLGVLAVRELCQLAFGSLGLHRMEGQVYGFNVAAIKTFERAGFIREGVRRRAFDRRSGWQDSVYLGRLIDDPQPEGAPR